MTKIRIEMDEETKNYLRSQDNVPEYVTVRGRKYYPKEYGGAGFKGVVWKGKDEYGYDVAIKFTIAEDYLERSYLEEACLATKLKGYPRFAEFVDVGPAEILVPNDSKHKFVCFIEEWVDGPPSKSILKAKTTSQPHFL